MENITYAYQFC